ncbi:MAG: PQQ-dependent sugar dehydrogenase [Verrucomicrobiae bacterium]|nr:PQQ-dependent sugar dehydrogenase [Verrucomicrobiae bacterium]
MTGIRGEAAEQTLQPVARGFVSPVAVTSLDAERLLVADQIGVVHVIEAGGRVRAEPFLDLRPRLTRLNRGFDERGVIGLALHPGFRENGKVYVHYSAPLQASRATNWNHTGHVSEFRVTPDGARVDPDSERVLLRIDQPYFNHNGGPLKFGPDGLLYISSGDGGNAHDLGFDRSPAGNGQDLTTLLGKILRIDVDRSEGGRPYGIPSDNPFLGVTAARPEIYAWGLRNPWGMSFDRGGTRELIAADVGQGRYEEVNLIRRGANYGWNQREGRHAFDPTQPGKVDLEERVQPADRDALVDPIIEYKNLNAFPNDPEGRGISVTGGYIYRGSALQHLQGRYVFGDWSRQWAVADGRLFVATRPTEAGRTEWTMEPLPVASHPGGSLGGYLVAFGEDAHGELYVMTTQRAGLVDQTGVVWKLVPSGGAR